MFVLSVSPEKAPNKHTSLVISFVDGDTVAVDGVRLSPAKLLARLNELGGRNGVGRIDIVENRFVGMKSRGVYETPGGTIMKVAHRAIEQITMDREVMHLRDELMPRYATMVYNGFWFAPEREALQALIDQSQKGVTGDVRLKLYKGNCIVTGRRAKKSLYDPELSTFGEDEVYNQKEARALSSSTR
jgi:argininosuccinate synthase